MAKIKTDRPGGAAYDGMACTIVREVKDGDPAYNAKTPQVVVLIDGKEVYFYANEVAPEKPATPAKPPVPAEPKHHLDAS